MKQKKLSFIAKTVFRLLWCGVWCDFFVRYILQKWSENVLTSLEQPITSLMTRFMTASDQYQPDQKRNGTSRWGAPNSAKVHPHDWSALNVTESLANGLPSDFGRSRPLSKLFFSVLVFPKGLEINLNNLKKHPSRSVRWLTSVLRARCAPRLDLWRKRTSFKWL